MRQSATPHSATLESASPLAALATTLDSLHTIANRRIIRQRLDAIRRTAYAPGVTVVHEYTVSVASYCETCRAADVTGNHARYGHNVTAAKGGVR